MKPTKQRQKKDHKKKQEEKKAITCQIHVIFLKESTITAREI